MCALRSNLQIDLGLVESKAGAVVSVRIDVCQHHGEESGCFPVPGQPPTSRLAKLKRYLMKKHSIRIPNTIFHIVWSDRVNDGSSVRKSFHDAVKTCGFSHFSVIVSEATQIQICYSSVVIVSSGMFLWWTIQTLNGQSITVVLPQAEQRQEVLFYCSNYSRSSQQEAVRFFLKVEGARPKCVRLSHVLT